MIIEIRKDIFEANINFKHFNKLLQDITYKRRYELFVDLEEIEDSEIYDRLDKTDKEIIKDYFNRFVTENKKVDYFVSTNNNADNIFNLDEAIRFFNEPVLIVLENDLNDAYFVDTLITHFRKKSKKIRKHKDEGWLKYKNAGGANNIPNTIISVLKTFENLSKDNKKYLRGIVIFDSDKEYPEMSLKPDKQKIIDFCIDNGIKYHILEKREMDNYIPDEIIERVADFNEDNYLKAYLNFSQIQKDYFDLEKGFKNKNFTSLSNGIQKFYDNINKNDYKFLRLGMTNENYKKNKKFKSEFPKLFSHNNITQQNLLERVKHQNNKNELQEILSKQ